MHLIDEMIRNAQNFICDSFFMLSYKCLFTSVYKRITYCKYFVNKAPAAFRNHAFLYLYLARRRFDLFSDPDRSTENRIIRLVERYFLNADKSVGFLSFRI